MNLVAVIPAHMASVRFPGKILYPILGLPMIEHVRRRALLIDSISEVIVATCDKEIASVIEGYGGKVVMTSSSHTNGTSRVSEAIRSIDCSHVVLLQGDEPLLLPKHVDSIATAIQQDPSGDAWNATGPIETEEELDRKSFVKCAIANNDRILYCFRKTPSINNINAQQKFIRKILGIIAYRKDFLIKIASKSESKIELSESIEQMRIIEHGYFLRSVPVFPSLPSVNEPGEIDLVLEQLKKFNNQSEILEIIKSM